ncbi:hypothetical protein TNCV_3577561 [Trichonephila clavipes]|uniref:Uncharacterized protein n=1 Tax=Trichonephila clavipes TaxID=2585209 RepID=A0A8X6RHV6_TRICX|nr:hypothetical protein TNCV_3577561 [Trichonephila clavipes]
MFLHLLLTVAASCNSLIQLVPEVSYSIQVKSLTRLVVQIVHTIDIIPNHECSLAKGIVMLEVIRIQPAKLPESRKVEVEFTKNWDQRSQSVPM